MPNAAADPLSRLRFAHLLLLKPRIGLDHDLERGQGQVEAINVVLAEGGQADLGIPRDIPRRRLQMARDEAQECRPEVRS